MKFTLTFLDIFIQGILLATPLLIFFVLMIIFTGQIVGRKEAWQRGDSLYWSFITATTVGYGDLRPTKGFSKFLSVVIAFFGLIFTGIVVSLAIHAATIAFKENQNLSISTKILPQAASRTKELLNE